MDKAEQLVRNYSGEIYGYLCRFVGDAVKAEDILGDVFVKMIEEVKKIRDETFAWRAWLYRVATNCAISHLRKQRIRNAILFKDDVPSETSSPEMLVRQHQEALRLKGAIEKLGKKHRAVLLMHVYQEMSYEDIAQALKISIGTVKSRISESKKRIRKILEESP